MVLEIKSIGCIEDLKKVPRRFGLENGTQKNRTIFMLQSLLFRSFRWRVECTESNETLKRFVISSPSLHPQMTIGWMPSVILYQRRAAHLRSRTNTKLSFCRINGTANCSNTDIRFHGRAVWRQQRNPLHRFSAFRSSTTKKKWVNLENFIAKDAD